MRACVSQCYVLVAATKLTPVVLCHLRMLSDTNELFILPVRNGHNYLVRSILSLALIDVFFHTIWYLCAIDVFHSQSIYNCPVRIARHPALQQYMAQVRDANVYLFDYVLHRLFLSCAQHVIFLKVIIILLALLLCSLLPVYARGWKRYQYLHLQIHIPCTPLACIRRNHFHKWQRFSNVRFVFILCDRNHHKNLFWY